ncbi:hypothetical protein K493DRAFT_207633 [Basidiobolus meristosporus CBS 931.73]|uniref:Velvet domain-containing protein n=1 Tax=Basidiobolus meristosporus CBS 931.73 TaxID=1314790 RepID=A0A1Y1YY10_9FUNG|nr:hypothetical protein K493DRAFT_207633 [Basidiobolus meristosporus CBS 931.73]|eukprot:ORY02910.1 hypothetical protein K493DRAFT_207633 [Basidiobolus meristosporus CBS 931.73]
MRQQPRQARLCSSKEKVDRRPIDPPPVVQICTDGDNGEDEYLQNPNFIVYVSLLSDQEELQEKIPPRRLAGTLVSSLHKLKDIDQCEKGFFIFPDISVRLEGKFRLRFNLYELISQSAVHLCSVVSDVFTVYSPKLFPGMSESTALSRVFSDQGVRIRIRKDRPR